MPRSREEDAQRLMALFADLQFVYDQIDTSQHEGRSDLDDLWDRYDAIREAIRVYITND